MALSIYSAKRIWTITLPNGNEEFVNTSCNETLCANSWAGRYRLRDVDKSEDIVFELNNVTIKDHGAKIRCQSRYEGGVEKASTCVLQVYHKPEAPVCQTNKTGDNIVFINCSTAKVFPGLKCSFAQFESKTQRVHILAPERIKYLTETADDGYFRSTCSATVNSLSPGTYQIFPVFQANNSKPVENSSVPGKPTTPVSIMSSPRQLNIYRDFLVPASEDCKVKITKDVFICEAHGFNSQTTLELFIGDTPALPMTTIVTETSNGNIYRTIFKPEATKTADFNGEITCFAKNPRQLSAKLAKVQELEEVQSSHAMMLDSNLENKLTCHGRNQSDGSTIQVTCFKEKSIIFTSNAQGENAEVSLKIGFLKATCICLSKDEKQCFEHKTLFQPTEVRQSDNGHTGTIITLALGLVICILVISLILVYVMCRLRFKHNVKDVHEKRNNIYNDYKQVPSDFVNIKVT